MHLHNRVNGEELKEKIKASQEERITLSFYSYYYIGNPQVLRDHLYLSWEPLGVLGRVYVAFEGINAQISVPARQFEAFRDKIKEITFLRKIRLNEAIEDSRESFYKLKIKLRKKIVADGLDDRSFDVTRKGVHVNAEEFNRLAEDPNTIIVDMRNHYETEVGHFKGAMLPDVDTFREALPLVEEALTGEKDKNIVMYCTGGIRCEKASAYYKSKGFKHVFQLEGGIIKYAHEVKTKGLKNKYVGKNFVFDDRLGERVSDEIIAHCHQCGEKCDVHTNCQNEACNLLFIQCPSCAEKYEGCCSTACQDFIHQPEDIQRELRKGKDSGVRIFSKGRFPGDRKADPKVS